MKPYHCPVCFKQCDEQTCLSQRAAKPRAGDLTICIGCGSVLVFTDDLSVREPTIAELMECDPETSRLLVRAMRALKQVKLETARRK